MLFLGILHIKPQIITTLINNVAVCYIRLWVSSKLSGYDVLRGENSR